MPTFKQQQKLEASRMRAIVSGVDPDAMYKGASRANKTRIPSGRSIGSFVKYNPAKEILLIKSFEQYSIKPVGHMKSQLTLYNTKNGEQKIQFLDHVIPVWGPQLDPDFYRVK